MVTTILGSIVMALGVIMHGMEAFMILGTTHGIMAMVGTTTLGTTVMVVIMIHGTMAMAVGTDLITMVGATLTMVDGTVVAMAVHTLAIMEEILAV